MRLPAKQSVGEHDGEHPGLALGARPEVRFELRVMPAGALVVREDTGAKSMTCPRSQNFIPRGYVVTAMSSYLPPIGFPQPSFNE